MFVKENDHKVRYTRNSRRLEVVATTAMSAGDSNSFVELIFRLLYWRRAKASTASNKKGAMKNEYVVVEEFCVVSIFTFTAFLVESLSQYPSSIVITKRNDSFFQRRPINMPVCLGEQLVDWSATPRYNAVQILLEELILKQYLQEYTEENHYRKTLVTKL